MSSDGVNQERCNKAAFAGCDRGLWVLARPLGSLGDVHHGAFDWFKALDNDTRSDF